MEENHFKKFEEMKVIELPEGYIAYRLGSGDNLELFDIFVNKDERQKGISKKLVKLMLEAVKDNPPNFSVFGFTAKDNLTAQAFYQAIGFTLILCPLYPLGAFMYVAEYQKLCDKLFKTDA